MGSIVVVATITIVNGNILSHDTSSETVEVYSPAVTLHLGITSPPSFNFDCSNRPDGTYPNYQSGCKSFYMCKNGQTSHFWCNSGEIYDASLLHCVSVHLGKCRNSTERKDKFESKCQADGVYPDYENGCRSFYFCKNGISTNYNCSPETKFDARRGSCVPSYQVSCLSLTCENKQDGVYEDVHGGCRRYYTCKGEVKREFICPPGEIYDRRRSSCFSVVEGAKCADLHFNCAGLPDGYYPDYQDNCHTFYLCIGGHPKSFYCPAGLSFNQDLLACDFSYRVTCKQMDICSQRKDGIIPNFDLDCREFAICENGTIVHSGICPQGKALDPETLICHPRSMMTCQPIRDIQCELKEDGIYVDVDSGCGTYYLCIKGRILITSFCPEGSSFHVGLGKCLSSPLVPCGDTQHSVILPNVCERRIGLYPDFDSHCRNYHVCAYGIRDTLTCPAGFIFDIKSQRCASINSTNCISSTLLATFKCPPEEEDRYLEFTDGCTTYHECWQGTGLTYKCPIGQHYHSSKQFCDSSDHICPRSAPKNDPSTISQVIQWQFNCSDKENGVYVSDQCGIFHLCVEGRIYSFICPPGRVFDMKTLSCRVGTCIQSDVTSWFADTGSFTCINKKDGMYPDLSTYCRRYYVCENGKTSIAYCREGEVFDEQIMTCVDASSANCTSVNSVRPFKPSRKIQIRVQRLETLTSTFRCPTGETGFFPDYQSGCRKFHICFRKLRKSYTCPSILLFNPITKSCDLPENVRCRPEERTAETFNCTSDSDRRLTDYDSDCKRYYVCMDNRLVAFNCPIGTVYNEAEGYCQNQAPCRKNASPTKVSNFSTHAHGVPNRYVFTCLGRPDGFYPDYARDCHVFYRCVRGKKFSHYCKQGLLFDPATGICQFEETVTCSLPPSVEVT